MTGPGHKKNAPLLATAERTWVVYVGLLAVLTAAEALVQPEIGLFDTVIDVAVLVTALPGCIVAWVFSAYCLLRGAHLEDTFSSAFRIAAGWFLGPVLGCVVVFVLNAVLGGDIDGGLLLFYLPLLAVMMPVFVLPPVMVAWRMKTRRGAKEH